MSTELIIGLMSGTSVDGIDATLVEFTSVNKLSVVETQFTPFQADLRRSINKVALSNTFLTRESDTELHTKLAKNYADASLSLLQKAAISASDITAIANHGQTVRHAPDASPPFSLQLGDGQRIANLTNITTLNQFRQADLTAGGQGAPLMPAFHQAIFGERANSYVLNLGGIANITRLGKTVVGFDTGPANTLMDQWAQLKINSSYDKNGEWANSGQVITKALDSLLEDPYFAASHPKSTGPDYFNLDWLNAQVENLESYAAQDVQASLLQLSVKTIAMGLEQAVLDSEDSKTGTIYVCGGGAQNRALMTALSKELSGYKIRLTDSLGIPSNWVESVGFAWLGYCRLHNIPSNLPSVTGAKKSVLLGEIYKPKQA